MMMTQTNCGQKWTHKKQLEIAQLAVWDTNRVSPSQNTENFLEVTDKMPRWRWLRLPAWKVESTTLVNTLIEQTHFSASKDENIKKIVKTTKFSRKPQKNRLRCSTKKLLKFPVWLTSIMPIALRKGRLTAAIQMLSLPLWLLIKLINTKCSEF